MDRLRNLVGGQFVNGGRDIVTGMDCWGLVMEVYRRYGMDVPDFTVSAFSYETIDMLTMGAAISKTWDEVKWPVDADAPLVVMMRIHPKYVTHAGVFVGDNRVIHTMQATGVVLSNIGSLRSRITGYYRYVANN